MPSVHHALIHVLMAIFAIGVGGCLIAIPVVAIKFAAVLFERDPEEPQASESVTREA
jgi:hypothetical protein